MIRLDGDLVTDDMTFACVLSILGFELSIGPGEKPSTAFWTVAASSHERDLQSYIREYRNGKLRVEPKRFMIEIRKIRKGLYKFLDHQPAAVGSG